MKSLKINIMNRIDNLEKQTAESTISHATHPIFSTMVADVSKQLNGELRVLSKLIMDSSGEKLSEVVNTSEQFHQTQEKRILAIEFNLAKLAPTVAAVSTHSSTSASSTPHVRSIEMEKCKVPTFSGKTLEYPEFKRGWQKIAATHWDEDNQIEQLKFKVDLHTKRIVSRCKNMAEVWEALDHEYAQELEVVNAEVSTTPEYIVKLRNYLPGLEDTLKSVNGLEHLQTPDKVNRLVEKFDERTQHDWEYYKSKSSGKTWDRFFSFILD